MRMTKNLAVLIACACLSGCASSIVRPSLKPARPRTDALLILPGFGYGREGEKTLRSIAGTMAGEGVDLYVPTYISRSGLAESRARLHRFIDDHRLARYERLHVFAFIAGAWTFNPLVESQTLPNLSTVIYDGARFRNGRRGSLRRSCTFSRGSGTALRSSTSPGRLTCRLRRPA